MAKVTQVTKVKGGQPLVLQPFCCWLLAAVLQRLLRVCVLLAAQRTSRPAHTRSLQNVDRPNRICRGVACFGQHEVDCKCWTGYRLMNSMQVSYQLSVKHSELEPCTATHSHMAEICKQCCRCLGCTLAATRDRRPVGLTCVRVIGIVRGAHDAADLRCRLPVGLGAEVCAFQYSVRL